jgi:hypothetical protein
MRQLRSDVMKSQCREEANHPGRHGCRGEDEIVVFCDIRVGEAVASWANAFERSRSNQARENLRVYAGGRCVARPNHSASSDQRENATSCVLSTMWYSAYCHL